MSLRTRIALLVGVTVLLASAIGGIGTTISSRSVGLDRVDRCLGGCERAERLQQIGVLRRLGFDVEANPGRAANGVFELVSGGDELARRFGSDALDRFELVSAGLADG